MAVTQNWKKGFTLVELMLSCAIISIFLLGCAAILSSAAKVYIQETDSSGARGAIETAEDDIKNYIMSGKGIKPLFYMNGTRTEIIPRSGTPIYVGKDTTTPFEKGTIFYANGDYIEPDGTPGTYLLSEEDQKKLAEVAEGVDLGYKLIYVEDDNKFIHGLPYTKDYYRNMTLFLEISEAENPVKAFHVSGNPDDVERKKEQKLYTVRLTGSGKNGIYTITSSTAVVSLNDSNYK